MAIFKIAKNGFWSKNFFRKIDLFDFTSVFCQNTIPTIAGDASSNVDASSSKMQFDGGVLESARKKMTLASSD